MPCLSTGQTPSDPHHLKMGWYRKGEKPPDDWCVPLVNSEHRRLHDIGEVKFWRELLDKDKQLLADVMRCYARSLYQDEMAIR